MENSKQYFPRISLLSSVFSIGAVFRLSRTRFIRLNRCFLLFTGIFLVAVIAGATVSYTSGLTTKDFFLGEADGIFVITGPGSTPVTSLVPEYLVHNLELVPGVTATSPEILAIGYINNRQDQLSIIRGVDPATFAAIDSPRVIDGGWFASVPGGGYTGALAGKSLASLLDLSPGDEIVISSTLTDVSLVTVITGIVETGTPIDDEIILPRAPAKMLSNAGPDSTTLIRVVFDSSTINREDMAHLVNSLFDIPIMITVHGSDPVDPLSDSILVKVFSYTGELISSKITGLDMQESFSLPFGLYYFEASFDPPYPGAPVYRVTKFIDGNLDEPLLLYLDQPESAGNISIDISLTRHDQPVVDHPVDLTDSFSGYKLTSTSNSTGHSVFNTSSDRLFFLNTTWQGLDWNRTFFGTVNSTFTADLGTDLEFSVLNATTLVPVDSDGVSVTVLKEEDNGTYSTIFDHLPVFNTSLAVLPLSPGHHLLELHSAGYSRSYSFNQRFTSRENFFIGNGTLGISVTDTNGTAITGVSVSATAGGEQSPSSSTVTASSGFASLECTTGLSYSISLQKGSFSNSFELFFDRPASFDAVLRQSYPLNIRVHDGSSPEKIALENVLLNITDGYSTLSQLTDSLGNAIFYLPDESPRELLVQLGDYSYSLNVSVMETPFLDIPLGDTRFDLSVLTPAGYPIKDALIRFYNTSSGYRESVITQSTDSSGHCSFTVPASLSSPSSFTVEASFHGSTRSWTVSFDSSSYHDHVFYFDLPAPPAVFHFSDSNGDPVEGLIVKLVPRNSGFGFAGQTALTNVTGHVTFTGLSYGYYELLYNWEGQQSRYITIDDFDEPPYLLFSHVLEFPPGIPPPSSPGDIIINKWPGNRQYLVTDTSNYVGAFLDTSLSVISLTFFCFIVIISTISFFIVTSIVSFPVFQHSSELRVLRAIGASVNQIGIALALQFALIALISSTAGVLAGYFLVTSIAGLGTANLAGILIVPRFDLLFSVVIVICSCLTVFLRTFSEVHGVLRRKDRNSS